MSATRSKLVHKVIDKKSRREEKKPFIHPNFLIDTKVDMKFKERMEEFIKAALERVVQTNPNLPAEDRYGAALTYIYLKKEQFKLDLKEMKAQHERVRKQRMSLIKAEEMRAAIAATMPASPAERTSSAAESSSDSSSSEDSPSEEESDAEPSEQ